MVSHVVSYPEATYSKIVLELAPTPKKSQGVEVSLFP